MAAALRETRTQLIMEHSNLPEKTLNLVGRVDDLYVNNWIFPFDWFLLIMILNITSISKQRCRVLSNGSMR